MAVRSILLVLVTLAAGACAGGGPTAPSPQERPALTTRRSEPAIGVVVIGRYSDGRHTYWPRLSIVAGTLGLTVNRIEFRFAGAEPVHVQTSTHALRPAQVYTYEPEVTSPVEVSVVAVTVSFVDELGRPGQVSSTTAVPPYVPGPPLATVRIAAFSVTEFMDGSNHAYWPKLTLTASSGHGAVTVTRLQFDLLGAGPVPPLRQSWQIDGGRTLELFHQPFYGEPEFYMTSRSKVDAVSVSVWFTDTSGRTGEVSAVATVTR